jgi:predicted ATP-binding protein involved in virulence
MKLRSAKIENFRAIRSLTVPLDHGLTVLHGNNANGKTSLLTAIAVGLGVIPTLLGRQGGISFKATDHRRGNSEARIRLEVLGEPEGLWWERLQTGRGGVTLKSNTRRVIPGTNGIRDYLKSLTEATDANQNPTIPVFAFYDTDRAVFDVPERKRNFQREFSRFDAYIDALARKTSFKALIAWFYAQENAELRQQREKNSFEYRAPALEAVRRAITKVMPEVSEPHIEHPARFVVRYRPKNGKAEKLYLEQLSGGYRIVLALVADLALRMSLANPHLDDPLESEAIVLIDEVELHLHPEWQQRVLGDLRRTFPNAQFIVSTHSPQVLTTVLPEHIVRLHATAEGVVAEREVAPTYGNEAGDVLYTVMGVDERPPIPYTDKLRRYRELIALDLEETAEAKALRSEAQQLSPADPVWNAIDVEILRRRTMREYAKQK